MTVEPEGFPKVLTLYLELSQYPILATQIRERMRQELFQRGVITPEAFETEARHKAIQSQVREGLRIRWSKSRLTSGSSAWASCAIT